MTYIGKAEVKDQIDDEGYTVGDTVAWKSTGAGRYTVLGFEGDRVTLSCDWAQVWSPQRAWFVKTDAPAKPYVPYGKRTVTVTLLEDDARLMAYRNWKATEPLLNKVAKACREALER